MNPDMIAKFEELFIQKYSKTVRYSCGFPTPTSLFCWSEFLSKNSIGFLSDKDKVPLHITLAKAPQSSYRLHGVYWVPKDFIEKALVLGMP